MDYGSSTKKEKKSAIEETITSNNLVQSGVSIIELILVTAIIAILGATTTPFISRFILQNNLDTTVDKVVGSIRKAQSYAMDGKGDQTWGVCKTGNILRFFSGSCSSPSHNEEFEIPRSVTITGLSEITFENLRGEPLTAQNITVQTDIDSAVINLNSAGGVDIN